MYDTTVGILDSSKDDFEDADEVYEAIGEVLHEVEQKSENEVRSVYLNKILLLIFINYKYQTISYELIL